MAFLNSSRGYGSLTKLFHWLIALVFALQYVSATIMLNTPEGQTTLGIAPDTYYNWHKSLGLAALLVTIARLINRRTGELPPWALSLTPLEKIIIHKAEQLLYAAMLVMPLSGYLYVTAGGYGVRLFGIFYLPDPIGSAPLLASTAKVVHIASAFLLLLPLGLHLGLVLGHQIGLKDKIIERMWPASSRRQSRSAER